MSRYEDVSEGLITQAQDIINRYFPELINAKIKILFDLKRRKYQGTTTFARISSANDLVRHFTADEINSEGVDYVLYLDKNIWENIEEPDRIRIIRHELQHCQVDPEAKEPYKTRKHELEDFYDEIEFNKDDPRWKERVFVIAESVYDSKKDEE